MGRPVIEAYSNPIVTTGVLASQNGHVINESSCGKIGGLASLSFDVGAKGTIPAKKETVIAKVPAGFEPKRDVWSSAVAGYEAVYLHLRQDGLLTVDCAIDITDSRIIVGSIGLYETKN